ncbi:hypothetical protein TorRG33x02_016100 [Trema orientale]|uniref:Uncharacterized protein n=1 Tax=Trema orientale TaxID=63057 RepID=A0A2P5FXX2_TREOI|nr:hypothetical protein TorRG33x02_016100 [Trema orientale]
MKESSTATCTVRGCLDAEKPLKVRNADIYRWPKTAEELLEKSDVNNGPDGKVSTAIIPKTLKYYDDDEKYYSSRQSFLRSYTFTWTKKETLGSRTRKWLKINKPKTLNRCETHDSYFGSGESPSFGIDRFSCLNVSCMTKPDVKE